MFSAALLSLSVLAGVSAQQIGTNTAETHPSMSWSKCAAGGTCTSTAGSVVLDSNWRWVHAVGGFTNCYTGQAWNSSICSDPTTCAQNCALDGADYSGTYGITSSGNALTLKFVTTGSNTNIGSRTYLMASNSQYQMFNLLNSEFTFDVDVSNLPCGLNGALYFSQMDADGGLAKYTTNKAGAQYGTGYCDSQCPQDIKFINGQANIVNWTASTTDSNAGTGSFGTCCNEMDIWEANSVSAAFTPHPCTVQGQTRCSGTDCGVPVRDSGICDPDGCDFNSFRMGVQNFYGPGMTVDTTKKFTVVTQFITADGTNTGTLSEIKRFYVQNGVTIPNSNTNIPGMSTFNSVTEAFCDAQKAAFGDQTSFQNHGGLTNMGKALQNMVLVMSIWDDHAANMLWLDSNYPTNVSASTPGVARGTCATTSGVPKTIEASVPNSSVTFSNIKFGPIGSTFVAPSGSSSSSSTGTTTTTKSTTTTTTTTKSTTTTTTTSTAPQPTQTHYGQCGGTGYTGPTVCASGTTCKAVSPPYYYQCL